MLSEAHLKLCDLSHQYLLFIYFDTYMSKYKFCVVIGQELLYFTISVILRSMLQVTYTDSIQTY